MEAQVTNNQNTSEPVATDVKGTVKWFHRARGFGFITRDDTNEDIFVHYTSIKPMSINLKKDKRRLNLMDKEKVVFDVVKTKDSFEAINVVGKSGYYIIDIIAFKREIPPYDLEIINDSRVTGKVKWFNVKIKYGFIHCDYNNEDVFVHSSAIVKNNPDKFKPSLSEGEPVEFDILKRADGKLEAVNVSGPHGSNVQGSRYSPDKTSLTLEGDTSSKKYLEHDLVGKVKWFNVKAGFGFINRNDNGQDVYAHYSAITKKNPDHSVRSLADGELVQFNLIEGSKGMEASDITGVNGGPVQGSEYARPMNSSNRTSVRNNSRNRTSSNSRAPRQRMTRNTSAGALNSPSNVPVRTQRAVRANGQNKPITGGMRRPNNNYGAPNAAPAYAPSNQARPQVIGQYTDNNYQYLNRQSRAPMNPGYEAAAAAAAAAAANQRYLPPNQQQQLANPMPNFSSMRAPPQQYSYNNSGNRYMNGIENAQYVAGPPPPPQLVQAPPPPQPPMGRNDQQAFDSPNGYYNNQRMAPPPNNYQYQTPANGNGILIDQRVQGFVKWYNFKNGFGFVTRSDNSQDIFVHKSGIQAPSNASQPSLDDGEPVEFDVYQDGTRLLAINVTGPDGNMLRGSKYATSNRMRISSGGAGGGGGGGALPPSKVYHRRKGN